MQGSFDNRQQDPESNYGSFSIKLIALPVLLVVALIGIATAPAHQMPYSASRYAVQLCANSATRSPGASCAARSDAVHTRSNLIQSRSDLIQSWSSFACRWHRPQTHGRMPAGSIPRNTQARTTRGAEFHGDMCDMPASAGQARHRFIARIHPIPHLPVFRNKQSFPVTGPLREPALFPRI